MRRIFGSPVRGQWLGLFLLAGITANGLTWASLRADEAEDLRATFRDEAPQAWEEYLKFVERLQGSREWTLTSEGKTKTLMRVEYKNNARCKLLWIRPLPGHDNYPRETLYAYNAFYGFNLSRKSSDAPWLLLSHRLGEGRDALEQWNRSLLFLRASIAIGGTDLPVLVKQPGFRVTQLTPVQRDDSVLAQVDFEHPCPTEPSGRAAWIPIKRGTILFDPDHQWTVRSATFRSGDAHWEILWKYDVEVRDPRATYPIPKKLVMVQEVIAMPSNLNKARYEGRSVFDFDLKEASSPPGDEEFTMSAFGLPEPMGAPKVERGSRWYLWIMLAAGVCLVLAFASYNVAQRLRAQKTGPKNG